jgi:hypothetical protein
MPSFRALFVCALTGAATACGVLLGADPSAPAPGTDAGDSAVAIQGALDAAIPTFCTDDPRAICETFDQGDPTPFFVPPKNGTSTIDSTDHGTTPPSSYVATTEPGITNNEASYQRFFDAGATELECTFAAKLVAINENASDTPFFRLQIQNEPDAGVGDTAPVLEMFLASHPGVGVTSAINTELGGHYGQTTIPAPKADEWIRYHVHVHMGQGPGDPSDLTADALHFDGTDAGTLVNHDGGFLSTTPRRWKLRVGLIFTNSDTTSTVKIDDVYCLPTP